MITNEQIDAMPAGEEMDRLVAEAKGECFHDWKYYGDGYTECTICKCEQTDSEDHQGYNMQDFSADWEAFGRLWEWCDLHGLKPAMGFHEVYDEIKEDIVSCKGSLMQSDRKYYYYDLIESDMVNFIKAFLKWALATGRLKGADDEQD